MKKLLSLILVLGIFLSVFTVQAADVAQEEATVSQKHLNNVALLDALDLGDYSGKLASGQVTRGEFASIIAKLLNAQDTEALSIPFVDVDKTNENYAAICAAYSYGIMNGVSSVKFAPDEFITYEQAIKCIVTVLGYNSIAGKYPEGYINIATKIKLLKNLGTSAGFTWEKALQLVVNSFDITVMTINSVSENKVTYTPDDKKTILGVYHNIFKSEGRMTDNGITTITSSPVYDEKFIVVNNIAGIPADDQMREYIGQVLEFYYQLGDSTRILYFNPDSISDDVLVINADDLQKDSSAFTKTNIVYNVNGKKNNAKVHQYADMIYNGKSFPTFLADDIKISAGTIKLIDSDNDGAYDIIIADEYRDIVVASIDVIDMIISDEEGMKYSFGEDVYAYFYDKNFNILNTSTIAVGNVISLFESKDGEYRKFVVSNATVTGTVDGFESADGVERVSVDGVFYNYSPSLLHNVDNNYSGAFIPEMGENLKIFLNYEGKIVDAVVNKRDFLYAYCLEMGYKKPGSNIVQMRVVTEKGDDVVLDSAKKIEINGVPKQDPSELLNVRGVMDPNGKFIPQLLRIKVNPAGEFKMVMTAQSVTNKLGFSDPDIFTLDYAYGKGSTSGRSYGGYYAVDNKKTIYFKLRRADATLLPEVTIVNAYPHYYNKMQLYDLDQFWTAAAMVYEDYDYYTLYQTKTVVVTKVYTVIDANGNPKKCIEGYQSGRIWSFVESEQGLIDLFIPEGVKVGDSVMVQVDAQKNLTIIKKLYSMSEKQAPSYEGKITSDGFNYVCGYLCAKGGTTVMLTMDDPTLGDKDNIQVRTIPSSANIHIYDVQEGTIRKATINELPVNATRVGDSYVVNNRDEMVYIKHTRQNATEVVLIRY